jgi:hypothetical protein
MTTTAEDAVCPFLGLPGDPATRFVATTPAHRCHARKRVAPIALDHQATFCLTPAHPACARFPTPRVAAAAAPQVARDESATVGSATGRRRRRAAIADGLVLAILLLVIGVVVAAVAIRAVA